MEVWLLGDLSAGVLGLDVRVVELLGSARPLGWSAICIFNPRQQIEETVSVFYPDSDEVSTSQTLETDSYQLVWLSFNFDTIVDFRSSDNFVLSVFRRSLGLSFRVGLLFSLA